MISKSLLLPLISPASVNSDINTRCLFHDRGHIDAVIKLTVVDLSSINAIVYLFVSFAPVVWRIGKSVWVFCIFFSNGNAIQTPYF